MDLFCEQEKGFFSGINDLIKELNLDGSKSRSTRKYLWNLYYFNEKKKDSGEISAYERLLCMIYDLKRKNYFDKAVKIEQCLKNITDSAEERALESILTFLLFLRLPQKKCESFTIPAPRELLYDSEKDISITLLPRPLCYDKAKSRDIASSKYFSHYPRQIFSVENDEEISTSSFCNFESSSFLENAAFIGERFVNQQRLNSFEDGGKSKYFGGLAGPKTSRNVALDSQLDIPKTKNLQFISHLKSEKPLSHSYRNEMQEICDVQAEQFDHTDLSKSLNWSDIVDSKTFQKDEVPPFKYTWENYDSDDLSDFLSREKAYPSELSSREFHNLATTESRLCSLFYKQRYEKGKIISKEVLYHDILLLLTGVSSRVFSFDIHGKVFVENVEIEDLERNTLQIYFDKFIPCAEKLLDLENFSKKSVTDNLTVSSFKKAVRSFLYFYRQKIAQIKEKEYFNTSNEQNVSVNSKNHKNTHFSYNQNISKSEYLRDFKTSPFSLLQSDSTEREFQDSFNGLLSLESSLQPWLSNLNYIYNLCSKFFTKKEIDSLELISFLCSETLNSIPSSREQSILLSLLNAAYIPFLVFLEKWIYEGKIFDPHSEFMTKRDGSEPTINAISDEEKFSTSKTSTKTDPLCNAALKDNYTPISDRKMGENLANLKSYASDALYRPSILSDFTNKDHKFSTAPTLNTVNTVFTDTGISTQPAKPKFSSYNRKYWTDKYVLQESFQNYCPDFLKKFAYNALECGKALRLLKMCEDRSVKRNFSDNSPTNFLNNSKNEYFKEFVSEINNHPSIVLCTNPRELLETKKRCENYLAKIKLNSERKPTLQIYDKNKEEKRIEMLEEAIKLTAKHTKEHEEKEREVERLKKDRKANVSRQIEESMKLRNKARMKKKPEEETNEEKFRLLNEINEEKAQLELNKKRNELLSSFQEKYKILCAKETKALKTFNSDVASNNFLNENYSINARENIPNGKQIIPTCFNAFSRNSNSNANLIDNVTNFDAKFIEECAKKAPPKVSMSCEPAEKSAKDMLNNLDCRSAIDSTNNNYETEIAKARVSDELDTVNKNKNRNKEDIVNANDKHLSTEDEINNFDQNGNVSDLSEIKNNLELIRKVIPKFRKENIPESVQNRNIPESEPDGSGNVAISKENCWNISSLNERMENRNVSKFKRKRDVKLKIPTLQIFDQESLDSGAAKESPQDSEMMSCPISKNTTSTPGFPISESLITDLFPSTNLPTPILPYANPFQPQTEFKLPFQFSGTFCRSKRQRKAENETKGNSESGLLPQSEKNKLKTPNCRNFEIKPLNFGSTNRLTSEDTKSFDNPTSNIVENNHSEDYFSFTVKFMEAGLTQHVNTQSKLINTLLLDKFLFGFDLIGHLEAIKNYMLFYDASFSRVLSQNLFISFPPKCSIEKIKPVELNNSLERSIENSTIKSFFAKNLSFYVNLSVPSKNQDSGMMPFSRGVELRYTADFPLNIILDSETIMRSYTAVNQYLVQLDQTAWFCEEISEILKLRAPNYNTNDVHRISIYRFKMHNTIDIIRNHAHLEIETLWKRFQRDLRNVSTLDELYDVNFHFCSAFIERCFLSEKHISIQKIFREIFNQVYLMRNLFKISISKNFKTSIENNISTSKNFEDSLKRFQIIFMKFRALTAELVSRLTVLSQQTDGNYIENFILRLKSSSSST